VQEVNEDLTDFLAIMDILGPDWKYLITDITRTRVARAALGTKKSR
jgi:hypothetical protein